MIEKPKFEVYRDNVDITNIDNLCKPLKTMLRRNKKEGMKYLLYVFFMEDLTNDNMMATVRSSEKDSLAKKLLFGDEKFKFTDEWDKKVKKARECYRTTLQEQFRKEISVYDNKLDQLGDLLDTLTPVINETVDDFGNTMFSTNIDILNKILKDIIDIIQTKTTLEAMNAAGDINRSLYTSGPSSIADKQLININ